MKYTINYAKISIPQSKKCNDNVIRFIPGEDIMSVLRAKGIDYNLECYVWLYPKGYCEESSFEDVMGDKQKVRCLFTGLFNNYYGEMEARFELLESINDGYQEISLIQGRENILSRLIGIDS